MASKSDVQLTELYERSRSQFPVFDSSLKNMAFMENAGGSQASTQFQHISGSSEHMKFHVSHSISGPSLCGRCYQRSFTFQQRSIRSRARTVKQIDSSCGKGTQCHQGTHISSFSMASSVYMLRSLYFWSLTKQHWPTTLVVYYSYVPTVSFDVMVSPPF